MNPRDPALRLSLPALTPLDLSQGIVAPHSLVAREGPGRSLIQKRPLRKLKSARKAIQLEIEKISSKREESIGTPTKDKLAPVHGSRLVGIGIIIGS